MTQLVATNIDEWRDLASSSFVPLSIQRSAADFSASLDLRHLSDGVSLSGISSQALIIDRTEHLTAGSLSDDIHISLQVNSRGTVIQNNNVTKIGPGVLTVCETHRPFTLNYVEPNQRHIVLQASRESLGVSDDVLRFAAGRQVAGINPARDAYISLVTSLMSSPDTMTAEASLQMSSIVTSLAGAMLLSAHEGVTALPTTDEALFVSMMEFIGSHLSEPFLTPETIARAHFISRSRLYEIFERNGTTPADAIRHQRVDRAAFLLRDPDYAGAPISDIAFMTGFGDVTTFTRAFRRYFGVTPRDYRSSP